MFQIIFHLLRFPNLLIVALTQYLLRYSVLMPILQSEQVKPAMSSWHFFCLVLCTVLIAAGGYVINDIVDYPIDIINKPKKTVVSKQISLKNAEILYHTINLLGFAIAFYLAYTIENMRLLLIYPLAVLLLWLYSHYFKKMTLTGNVVVSFFCAFVAIIVLFAERSVFFHLSPKHTLEMLMIFVGYGIFAYFSTMFREIVKDIEDKDGDIAYQCQTLPIVAGVPFAKRVAYLFGTSLFLFLLYAIYNLYKINRIYDIIYIILLVIAPLVFAMYSLEKSKHKAEFHCVSQWAKWVMLSGILYLPLYAWAR